MGCFPAKVEQSPFSPLIKESNLVRYERVRQALIDAGYFKENNLSVDHTTNTTLMATKKSKKAKKYESSDDEVEIEKHRKSQ